MRGLQIFLLLGCAIAAPPALSSPRVGIAPPRVSADAAVDARVVATALETGAARAPITVVSIREMGVIATRGARAGLVCDVRDASCAARLAAFSGLDFVVVTEVLGAGQSRRVELTLVDGRDGSVTRRRAAPLDATGDDAATGTGVEATVLALLRDAPVRGRLDVRGPAGDAVDVDGVVHGTAPIQIDVDAGLRVVNGTMVRVPAAGLVVIEASTPPPGPGTASGVDGAALNIMALSTIGVGGVLGLAGSIGAIVVAPDPARRDAFTARAWNDAVGAGRGLVVVAVVGAGLVAAGSGLWLAQGGGP